MLVFILEVVLFRSKAFFPACDVTNWVNGLVKFVMFVYKINLTGDVWKGCDVFKIKPFTFISSFKIGQVCL